MGLGGHRGHTVVAPLPSHPALLEDTLIPLFRVKDQAEQEQLKVPLITI